MRLIYDLIYTIWFKHTEKRDMLLQIKKVSSNVYYTRHYKHVQTLNTNTRVIYRSIEKKNPTVNIS